MRNPQWFIREVLEVGLNKVVWDRGYLTKYNIDPLVFWTTYAGAVPHRTLVLDDYQAIELGPDNDFSDPVAVYPAWQYGMEWGVLEELCSQNVAEDTSLQADKSIPSHLKPRPGQEHRIVVSQVPNLQSGLGRKFIGALRDLQEEYPDVNIHVHALYSFRYMFSHSFRSVDIDPSQRARGKQVELPNGKVVKYERAAEVPHWVNLLSMYPADLKVPRQRCMYNMLSAVWASRYYRSTVKFSTKKTGPNPKVDETTVPLPVNHAIMVKRAHFQEGDKFLCDFCSVQNTCKYFRVGAICALGDSDVAEFADQFDTRDASTIVDGLGSLLRVQAQRASEMREEEQASGDTNDAHLTKTLEGIFDRALRLARFLHVPTDKGVPGATNVSIGGTQIMSSDPKQLMAAVTAELEGRGIAREDITEEMIRNVLENPAKLKERAIDVGTAEVADDNF